MNQIDMSAVKQQLREFTQGYQRPLRGKLAVLMPLRDEVLELARKGAASGEIASVLAQYQITVSKDTVSRFLRQETKKERTPRAKKNGSEAQTNGGESATARPVLMPRGLTAPANQ
jgi:IS30 family transposase